LVSWGSNARSGGAALAVLAAASAACSVLTTFDGFSGADGGAGDGALDVLVADSSDENRADSPGPPAVDAGAIGDSTGGGAADSDSGAVDSPAVDTSTADSSVTDAAAADTAASGVDSASPTDGGAGWCASQPGPLLFCDDFDEGPLLSGFDALDQMNCTAQLDPALYVSPSYSMSATSQQSMQTFNCGGIKVFPGPIGGLTGTTYKLAFDVRPLSVDTSAQSDTVAAVIRLTDSAGTLWALQFEPMWDTTNGVLSVDLSEDTEFVDGGEQFQHTIASGDLPLSTFTRVTLSLTVGPQNVPQTAQLFFGGVMVAAANLHPTTSNPTVSFLLGFSYVGPQNAPWSMLYDNVTFSAN
jgi:hypothetical protein